MKSTFKGYFLGTIWLYKSALQNYFANQTCLLWSFLFFFLFTDMSQISLDHILWSWMTLPWYIYCNLIVCSTYNTARYLYVRNIDKKNISRFEIYLPHLISYLYWLFELKPKYFKKQSSLSSFLLTSGNNTGPNWPGVHSRLVSCF